MPRGAQGRTTVNGRPFRSESGPFEAEIVAGTGWMLTADWINERHRAGWELARVFSLGGNEYSRLWRRREREKKEDSAE